jgi:hypothetical protein
VHRKKAEPAGTGQRGGLLRVFTKDNDGLGSELAKRAKMGCPLKRTGGRGEGADRAWPDTEVRILPRPPSFSDSARSCLGSERLHSERELPFPPPTHFCSKRSF